MKNNETLTQMALDLLHNAVVKGSSINISDSLGFINTYDDASGQRDAYLSFFSYTSNGINLAEPVDGNFLSKEFFVRRKLSFVNNGDEGKQDAILLVLRGWKIKNAKEISINDNLLIIDNIQIRIN